MSKIVELAKRAWKEIQDHPGAVLTGVLVAVLAIVLLRVGGFLAGMGG